jgi:hypothetical protein
MDNAFNWDRKLKSNDIVNGIARVDIFDNKGVLLVKKGSRIRELHYQRMREEGLIQQEKDDSKPIPNKLNINYSAPDSVHSRLGRLISSFSSLQKRIVDSPEAEMQEELRYLCDYLSQLCDENIYQVLGELYLAEARFYCYTKPLYIAASLNELVKRYNQYHSEQQISPQKTHHLMQAALLHNLGLLSDQQQVYGSDLSLTTEQRIEIRRKYPQASVDMAQKIGITENDVLMAISQHNIESENPLFEAQLLRMPFVYAGIAMREQMSLDNMEIINPTREFARLFAENKLDPILGGLFLKINGLAPVGAILQFDSYEKALIISGPGEGSIASSQLRLITNRSGVQLARPGDRFRLDRTELVQKGMNNHHQFAWNKFSPFAAWEK